MPMWACSSCWAASLPSPALSPPPGHEKHARLACFSCSAALLPQPLSPTHRTCPHGHVLRAGLPPHPLLHSHPAKHEKHATRACFSCLAALLPQPLSPTQKSCPQGHFPCSPTHRT